MKKTFLISLITFLIISCGVQLEDTNGKMGSTIGEIRGYMPKSFSADAMTTLSHMCNALEVKENYYEGEYIDSNNSLNFETSEQKCGEDEAQTKNISLKLKSVGTKVQFVNEAGSSERFFSDYETRHQGVIAELCNELVNSGVVQSVRKFAGAVYADWYSISNSATICGAPNSVCLIKERGIEISSGRFEIRKAEKIVVSTKVASFELGVVTHRELASSCVNSKEVELFSSTRKF